MADYTGTDHIRIDIGHASCQMIAALYCCGMISIFPVGPFSIFSLIVFLPRSSRYQLHRIGNDIPPSIIFNEQVNMLCEVPDYVKLAPLFH